MVTIFKENNALEYKNNTAYEITYKYQFYIL